MFSLLEPLREEPTSLRFPRLPIVELVEGDGKLEIKRRKGLKIQSTDYQGKIDNIVLVVGMYDHNSCIPVAN